ncbi:7887_t:CDS:2 [Dentiscutata erythropus]|uniref:7887_t:CDS:1 n=1 Tax=Dentiscutata erythropus TaxID=1348616 RepID=A0A9N9EL67_9GLOM|nr:7887_t:CDS:2 [Dentiscutata erythropus]
MFFDHFKKNDPWGVMIYEDHLAFNQSSEWMFSKVNYSYYICLDGRSFCLYPSSNGLLSDTSLSLTSYKTTAGQASVLNVHSKIPAKMVGNQQSSSSPDRYDKHNEVISRPNGRSVKSNVNSVSHEYFSNKNQLLMEKTMEFTFSGPIRSLALFISFSENVTNEWSAKEFHRFGFHSIFKSFNIADHTKAYEFILDCAVNCWANMWKIVVMVSSDLKIDKKEICEFVKKIRKVFDRLTLDVIVIRLCCESNFQSHLKWRINKDKSFVVVVYEKDTIKESFEVLLYEICRAQQSTERSYINFYSKCDPYYEFTNFFPVPVIIDGVKWPTAENYFQAKKFKYQEICNEIREAQSAREAFNIGRCYDRYKRHDWEHKIPNTREIFKENVMRTALMAKFGQHEHLKYLLLSTGNIPFFEHTKNDSYWGDGGDFGGGQNKLGILLREVREFYMLKEVQKIASKYERNYEKWIVEELHELQQFE